MDFQTIYELKKAEKLLRKHNLLEPLQEEKIRNGMDKIRRQHIR